MIPFLYKTFTHYPEWSNRSIPVIKSISRKIVLWVFDTTTSMSNMGPSSFIEDLAFSGSGGWWANSAHQPPDPEKSQGIDSLNPHNCYYSLYKRMSIWFDRCRRISWCLMRTPIISCYVTSCHLGWYCSKHPLMLRNLQLYKAWGINILNINRMILQICSNFHWSALICFFCRYPKYPEACFR